MSCSPRIQISGSAKGAPNYEKAVLRTGGIPVTGYCPAPDLSCDGLLLCGGEDLAPILYGQENRGSQPPDPARDEAELHLIAAFLTAGKPILGICRGMQAINVAFGGTLIQDLPEEVAPAHAYCSGDSIHPIRTLEGSLLARLYAPEMTVNSSHHQAVDRLGEGFQATAWAAQDVVEAMEHRSHPIFAVQFHPERMTGELTDNGDAIVRWLVEQCGK